MRREKNKLTLTRRTIVQSMSCAALITGPASAAFAGQPYNEDSEGMCGAQGLNSFVDAHVHLFNAADLPVNGFLKYVVIPDKAPRLQNELGNILADAVAFAIQRSCMTARVELRRLRSSLMPSEYGAMSLEAINGEEYTEAEVIANLPEHERQEARERIFIREFEKFMDQGLNRAGHNGATMAPMDAATNGDEASANEEDYAELERFLIISALATDEDQLQQTLDFDQEAFQNSLVGSQYHSLQATNSIFQRQFALRRLLSRSNITAAGQILKWAVTMTKTRGELLKEYKKIYIPSHINNVHLISYILDMDEWVNDRPIANSEYDLQYQVMNVLANREEGVQVSTFAGFDPLRFAREKAERDNPDHWTFTRLKTLFQEGRISGFKLYPPMGFRPIGNADLDGTHNDFQQGVKQRWSRLSNEPLGMTLDNILREFYAWCSSVQAPICAHAGNSNEAGPGYGLRASPRYWLDVMNEFPELRLNLNHFTDAEDFIRGSGQTDAERFTSQLIAPSNTHARVYADFGYMEELLTPRAQRSELALRFFRRLRSYCEVYDREVEQLMYGSDWVMLGLEPEHESYMDILFNNMRAAGFCDRQVQNFFHDNALRYLNG